MFFFYIELHDYIPHNLFVSKCDINLTLLFSSSFVLSFFIQSDDLQNKFCTLKSFSQNNIGNFLLLFLKKIFFLNRHIFFTVVLHVSMFNTRFCIPFESHCFFRFNLNSCNPNSINYEENIIILVVPFLMRKLLRLQAMLAKNCQIHSNQ